MLQNKWIHFIVFLITAFFLAYRIEFSLSRIFPEYSTVMLILVIPVIEEMCKFLVYRATNRALAMGIGWGVFEMFIYGIEFLDRLVLVPHFLFAIPYARFGWKALPIATGLHIVWNAYMMFPDPISKLFSVAVLVFTFLALWWLRNDGQKSESGENSSY